MQFKISAFVNPEAEVQSFVVSEVGGGEWVFSDFYQGVQQSQI